MVFDCCLVASMVWETWIMVIWLLWDFRRAWVQYGGDLWVVYALCMLFAFSAVMFYADTCQNPRVYFHTNTMHFKENAAVEILPGNYIKVKDNVDEELDREVLRRLELGRCGLPGFGSATNGAAVCSQRMLPSACLRWMRLVRPPSTSVALARLARLAKRRTNLPLSLVDCSTHTARAQFVSSDEPVPAYE